MGLSQDLEDWEEWSRWSFPSLRVSSRVSKMTIYRCYCCLSVSSRRYRFASYLFDSHKKGSSREGRQGRDTRYRQIFRNKFLLNQQLYNSLFLRTTIETTSRY